MEIKNVEITGYKGISHLKFSPKKINILVGKNNTGKTSVLQAIDLLFNNTHIMNKNMESYFNIYLKKSITISANTPGKNKKIIIREASEVEIVNAEIIKIEARINEINKYIQKTTGLERENLVEEVTLLNSKIAADKARNENFEKKLNDNEIRKSELQSNLKEYETELIELRKASPRMSKNQEDIKKKKLELKGIEEKKEKLYSIQSDLSNISDRIRDKEKSLERNKFDSK